MTETEETYRATPIGRVEVILRMSDPDYVAERLCALMSRREAIELCEQRNRPELVSALGRFVPTRGEG